MWNFNRKCETYKMVFYVLFGYPKSHKLILNVTVRLLLKPKNQYSFCWDISEHRG